MPTIPPPPGLVAFIVFTVAIIGYEVLGLVWFGVSGTLSAAVWWLCDRWPEASLLISVGLLLAWLHLVLRIF